MSDAEVLTVLDRLGELEDVVEAQRPDERPGPSTIGQIALVALLAVFVIGPIFTSVYLARRAR